MIILNKTQASEAYKKIMNNKANEISKENTTIFLD